MLKSQANRPLHISSIRDISSCRRVQITLHDIGINEIELRRIQIHLRLRNRKNMRRPCLTESAAVAPQSRRGQCRLHGIVIDKNTIKTMGTRLRPIIIFNVRINVNAFAERPDCAGLSAVRHDILPVNICHRTASHIHIPNLQRIGEVTERVTVKHSLGILPVTPGSHAYGTARIHIFPLYPHTGAGGKGQCGGNAQNKHIFHISYHCQNRRRMPTTRANYLCSIAPPSVVTFSSFHG